MAIRGGGGGGTRYFSSYVGWDPASTVHPPKNISNFKHPQKIFEILATQKYPHSIPCPYEKTLKCITMTPKYRPIFGDPSKYPQNLYTPKNIHFSENPQKY